MHFHPVCLRHRCVGFCYFFIVQFGKGNRTVLKIRFQQFQIFTVVRYYPLPVIIIPVYIPKGGKKQRVSFVFWQLHKYAFRCDTYINFCPLCCYDWCYNVVYLLVAYVTAAARVLTRGLYIITRYKRAIA